MVIPVVVGGLAFVNTTSSVAAVQGGFVTVHLNVTLVPAGTPVTPEVGDDGFAIVAVPLTTVHVPVPAAGVFPARVKFPLLQFDWSGPAFAVGGCVTSTVTFDVAVQPFTAV